MKLYATDPQDAIDNLLRFIKNNPINPEPYRALGDIYYKLKLPDQTMFYYGPYLDLNQNSEHTKDVEKRIKEMKELQMGRYQEKTRLNK